MFHDADRHGQDVDLTLAPQLKNSRNKELGHECHRSRTPFDLITDIDLGRTKANQVTRGETARLYPPPTEYQHYAPGKLLFLYSNSHWSRKVRSFGRGTTSL